MIMSLYSTYTLSF